MSPEKTMKVYPSPKLAERDEYLPGVGADGAEVPADKAQGWLDAGLAVKNKPSKSAEPPAEKSEE